jgi:nicotinamidase/pyrazinamidase
MRTRRRAAKLGHAIAKAGADMQQYLDRRVFLGGGFAAAVIGTTLASGLARAAAKIASGERDVFIVIDVQNCFVPGGSLAVGGGDEIVPLINRIAKGFRHVVMTQDWHTPHHVSFASSHPGKKPFDLIDLPYGKQVLWPDHCVQGTPGADLVAGLSIPHAELVLRKGYRDVVDSYSAFNEADRRPTGLGAYLRERGLKRVFLAGLATDFCVGWSAVDARKAGFDAYVIEDACRGINANGSLAKAWADMKRAGVHRLQSADLALA